MTGFQRYYTSDPGLEELAAIEGVVAIDREPPNAIIGVGSGVAHCVAEFEDGPFESTYEVTSGGDFLATFGGLGYTYDEVQSNYPCAVARKADSAISAEYWNGNGYIALANKKFRRLLLTRVDTSVGSVSFTRLASVSGSGNFNFDLETGQHIDIKLDGAGAVVATFTGVAATVNSAAGTYPSTFTGGETITVKVDDVTYVITFLAADQTQAQIISRLNLALGFTAFVSSSATVIALTGRRKGTGGNVQIVAVSGALVTTATGFSAGAATAGTGNVSNIDQVTFAEVKSIVETAVTGSRVDRDFSGLLRVSNTTTPGTGTIEVSSATTALGLGFTPSVVATAPVAVATTIPAGTRVQTAGAVVFVTMQTVAIPAGGAGPYTVKVRHAIDDGTGTGLAVSTLTAMTGPIQAGSFAVTNTQIIAAALTEAAIDAKYATAIDKTRSNSSIAKETNLFWSARQSNAIRSQIRTNAVDASAGGCRKRTGIVSPPLGTTRANARSTVSQPGVGTYRKDRVIYAYPGVTTRIPAIAARGLAGGQGFTANGVIDVHFDSWVAATCSQLPPEENPGQQNDAMLAALSVEAANSDVQNLEINDYRAFKAAGIAAPRFDDGTVTIQSGVTSVDPAVQPGLKNISRRRMTDFLIDSLSIAVSPYDKKLATISRRAQTLGEVGGFLEQLVSKTNPASQRIEKYSIDGKSGNTPLSLAAGVFRIIVKVKLLASLDVIVLDITAGEAVVVDEAA